MYLVQGDRLRLLCTMGKLKMFGIGMTVAVALLAYFLYTPMPPEAEEPYRQMAFLARFKLVLGLVSMKYHLNKVNQFSKC